MQDIFKPNQINYILRTYVPTWRLAERLEEVVEWCKETGTEHVMLAAGAGLIVWNQLTPEEVRRETAAMRVAKDRLAREGIRIGINSSYRFTFSPWEHRLDYDHWETTRTGRCLRNSACLLDPKLEKYLKVYYTILAEVAPDYIYVDDDHRYVLQGVDETWGCFCDLHLAKFGDLTGRTWTRESLDQAILKEPPLRRQWIDFLGSRLLEISRIIADAVHSVNPEIEVGLMIPCIHPLTVMGHTVTNVLDIFRGRGRPVVRPPIGPYSDWNRREIIPGLFYIEYTGHLLGDEPEYTVEIETIPFTRFSKSMAIVRFHMIQAALNRMTNYAITACGYMGDSPFLEPAFVTMLKGNRAYFETVRSIAPKRGTRKGIQFIWDSAAAKLATRRIERESDLYWPSFVCHDILGNMGFPYSYDESPVRFLAGESVRAFSRERIEEMLSGGLLLDVNATRALGELGYRDKVGCEIGAVLRNFGAEQCTSEEFSGPYVNTYIPLYGVRLTSPHELRPAEEGALAISRITDNDRREIAPGVVIFQNSLGGKVAVLPYTIQGVEPNIYHMFSYHRRYMLKRIFEWMSPEVLALQVEEPTDFAIQVWDDGSRITGCLTNLSYDATSEMTVAFTARGLNPARAKYISETGKLAPLERNIEVLSGQKGTKWLVKHYMAAFAPLVFFVER